MAGRAGITIIEPVRTSPSPSITRLPQPSAPSCTASTCVGTDDAIVGLIGSAVAEHHVVVLREQFLSAEQHAAVASSFGRILASPSRTIPVSSTHWYGRIRSPAARACSVAALCDTDRRAAGADGRLLTELHSMLDDPHVQMRWRWREGDFVIWDETATCHRALTDHHPRRRVMRRCVTGAE